MKYDLTGYGLGFITACLVHMLVHALAHTSNPIIFYDLTGIGLGVVIIIASRLGLFKRYE